MLAKASHRLALTTIVIYDRSFIVLANVVTIVNYDRKSFITLGPGLIKAGRQFVSSRIN
jgi:hypothetical protein